MLRSLLRSSGQTKLHYPVRSTSFHHNRLPKRNQRRSTTSARPLLRPPKFKVCFPYCHLLQEHDGIGPISYRCFRIHFRDRLSVGSISDSKGGEDGFARALKSLLSAASVASTSTNSTPTMNPPVVPLAPPPNKPHDLPSPSWSGEDDAAEAVCWSAPRGLIIDCTRFAGGAVDREGQGGSG